MKVEPYLSFEGRCEEAIEFYRRAIGAEVEVLMRFKDMPEPREPGMVTPENEHKVMHAEMRIGDSKVMLSDGHCTGQASKFEGSYAVTASKRISRPKSKPKRRELNLSRAKTKFLSESTAEI